MLETESQEIWVVVTTNDESSGNELSDVAITRLHILVSGTSSMQTDTMRHKFNIVIVYKTNVYFYFYIYSKVTNCK